jgi:hypothetical protein
MANEITGARTKVKTKLDITVTTFDSMLLECLEQAIPRLAPFIQLPLAEDVTTVLTADTDKFTLPVAGSHVKRLYKQISTTDPWVEIDIWRQHGDVIYLNDAITTTTTVKILAHRPYKYTDADFALLATNSPASMLPLYLFAMAEFATYIVGNKRKFNIYQQMNGVRTLAEMQELAQWYENKAIRILEDEISAEGQ